MIRSVSLILITLFGISTALAGAETTGAYFSAGPGQYALNVNSATTLTVPVGTVVAEICVETQAIRYTDDGTTPTASTGMPVPSGTCFQYAGPLNKIKIIAQTSGATVDVSYYKTSQ